MNRDHVVVDSRAELESAVARATLVKLTERLASHEVAHIVVTGGSVGIGTLAAIRRDPMLSRVDWTRVHVWWGDERFVPRGSANRNDAQAEDALFDHIDIPDANLHPFPSSDGVTLNEAVEQFRQHLSDFWGGSPRFDLVLNGIGPDGHVASLFPGRAHGSPPELVIGVHDSPKPPAERISFTFRALNSADSVWIIASGLDKADAIARLMSDDSVSRTPASGLCGKRETIVWIDDAAASRIEIA